MQRWTWCRSSTIVAVALGVAGCQEVGAPEPERGTVRLLLQLGQVLSGETLDLGPHYQRTDQTIVQLAPLQVPLELAATQTITVTIDISACLADPARAPAGAGCPLRLALVLRNAQGEELDSQVVGPLDATPGASLSPPAVTLRQAETIVLTPGLDTLFLGATRVLAAQILDRTGTPVLRRLTWTSSNPAVATVDADGLVTALTPGTTTVTARLEERPTGPSGTATITALSSGGAVIGPAGGTVYSRGGELTLSVPSGALAAPTPITIQPNVSAPPSSRLVPGTAFTLEPAGLAFQQPATLTVRYNPGAIPAGVMNEPALRLFTVTGTTWQEVPGSVVNPTAHTVTRQIDGFSTYGVLIAMVGVRSLAVGGSHTCAVLSTGTALCWGSNGFGELGNGTTGPAMQPAVVQGALTFITATAGNSFTCGLTSAGQVYCWGRNTEGTLGNGSTTDSPQPQAVLLAVPVMFLEAGFASACSIDQSQSAYCWGSHAQDQLGVPFATTCGTTPCSPVPIGLGPSIPVTTISGGLQHRCGVSATFAACWGWNQGGQLGLPTTTVSSLTPVPPPTGAAGPFTQLFAGQVGTCGLLADGTAYCWGNNFFGSRGDGTTSSSILLTAQPVVGGLRFALLHLVAGNSVLNPTCGVTLTGEGYCWGANYRGSLGTTAPLATCTFSAGTTMLTFGCTGTPVPIVGGLRFQEIQGGTNHVCGLTLDGEVWCWGGNEAGQVGDGTLVDAPTPRRVQ